MVEGRKGEEQGYAAAADDLTDGKGVGEWRSRYPRQAWVQIIVEAICLSIFFVASFSLIFANWKGWIDTFLTAAPKEILNPRKYVYYMAAGLLGGTVFGIKFFYRVVARGWWHQDRIMWRLLSPLLAMTLAFVLGTLIDSSWIGAQNLGSAATCISIGFLVGYFADEAIAKMYEIATVIFGAASRAKTGDGK